MLARVDEDGYLYIVDRLKDMIVTGGENVYSKEVEDVLCTHSDVQDVAVIGRPHPEWGETVVAVLTLKPGKTLVHDDLPCFDNAATRRGRPSVQAAFGEPLAVLTGDALIVLAFQALAGAAGKSPARLAPLMTTIAAGTGMPFGIVAGQAWECEPKVNLSDYQRAKTGALFAAATAAGAQAAGADPARWRDLGERLGDEIPFTSLHEVIDREVVLPVIQPRATTNNLLELNHRVDGSHKHDMTDIARIHTCR
jgi:acyl-CoA synthetase (AMP-forming)/AMP-acid ligase II